MAPAGVGVADLDTEHLLWGVPQREPQQALVRRAGADPAALLAELGGPARRGEIDPVVGRAGEIEQAGEILSRRTKNNRC